MTVHEKAKALDELAVLASQICVSVPFKKKHPDWTVRAALLKLAEAREELLAQIETIEEDHGYEMMELASRME